jgi:hypothetical protein
VRNRRKLLYRVPTVRAVLRPRLAMNGPRFVPLLIRDLTEQAEVLIDSFDDALNDPERLVRPARSAQDAHRLGVCIFVVEEPTLVDPVAETSSVTARRGRQPG